MGNTNNIMCSIFAIYAIIASNNCDPLLGNVLGDVNGILGNDKEEPLIKLELLGGADEILDLRVLDPLLDVQIGSKQEDDVLNGVILGLVSESAVDSLITDDHLDDDNDNIEILNGAIKGAENAIGEGLVNDLINDKEVDDDIALDGAIKDVINADSFIAILNDLRRAGQIENKTGKNDDNGEHKHELINKKKKQINDLVLFHFSHF